MKKFTITQNDANQRLDKFLKKLLVSSSISLIYKLNRTKKIKVNDLRQDNEYKLAVGDQIALYLTDDDFQKLTAKRTSPEGGPSGKGLEKQDILYEDGSLLVLNKSSWINVHPWDHKTKESNIIAQVHDYLGEKLKSLTFAPSLVHRIDRDTSGILLIAKEKALLSQLVEDFKDHKKVKKTYFALVFGSMPASAGTISHRLTRIEDAKNENKIQVDPAWQIAITHYQVLKTFAIDTPEWLKTIQSLELKIDTGRMHQIRVHLATEGAWIIGDTKYGNEKWNAFFSKYYQVTRQQLHAWKIDFLHYTRKKPIHLEARLKSDMQSFLEILENKMKLKSE